MTVDEYRKKHKRCKTCEYAIGYCYAWECLAKGHSYDRELGRAGIKGCFCRLYKPTKEKNNEQN